MNDPENFLTRWSRRKREARMNAARRMTSERSATPRRARASALRTPCRHSRRQQRTSKPAEPAFDLSTAAADRIDHRGDRHPRASWRPACRRTCGLRRFAARGSPIPRSGISSGSNDYDFDFHTPGAIPGFGPLEMTDELRREVLRIVGDLQPEPKRPARSRAPSSGAAEAGAPASATPGSD